MCLTYHYKLKFRQSNLLTAFSEKIWKEDVPRIFGDLLPKDATKKKIVAANHN